MKFEIEAKDNNTNARAGKITTAHSEVETPVFMPVGTQGTVKAMTQEMLEEIDARIILGNTYHLFLRPGMDIMKELGGLHKMTSWDRSILTDSGGYQVFSLGELRKIKEEGVHFKSHLDGSNQFISPEVSMQIQRTLGSDIVMAFDECTPYPATRKEAKDSLDMTARWALRSRNEFDLMENPNALFGIIQGGVYNDLRKDSLDKLLEIGFAGYAIGGLSVGEEKSQMYDVTEYTAPLMPQDKPRYLMGVGTPQDLIECVARGIDMFDCVMPTRNARNGQVFTSTGKLNIRNAKYSRDDQPFDSECKCKVCNRYSRAYVRHLYNCGEILASVLCSYHNLYFYLDTMNRIRQSIKLGVFAEFRLQYLSKVDQRI